MAGLAPLPAATKQCTLLLLQSCGRVLLGLKKRGFGAGKYNGFGGKIEPGETLFTAARREMLEESGVDVPAARYAAHLRFTFAGAAEALHVHVFAAAAAAPPATVASDEMEPEWFDAAAPPLGRMWADDSHWLPAVLGGATLRADFDFDGLETITRAAVTLLPDGAPPCDYVGDPATAVLLPRGAPAQGALEFT